jgi:hypothetical protein
MTAQWAHNASVGVLLFNRFTRIDIRSGPVRNEIHILRALIHVA